MSPPPPTAPTPADPRPARPDEPDALQLLRESHGPRVELVAFAGHGAASDAQRDELARVAISRASGTHVVLAAMGAAGGAASKARGAAALAAQRLPADVERLAGGGGVELTFRGAKWRLFAPRGSGRVLHPVDLDLETARAGARALAEPAARADFEQAVDALVAEHGRASASLRAALGEGEAEALDVAALDVADERAAAALGHSIERGGELCLEPLPGGGAVAARLVRGSERLVVELRRHGEPLRRESLVLLRCTAPADRGALLRVELDDEDLGPWRLGEPGDGAEWSLDLFRIPGDLLAGRDRATLAFTVADGREVASIRWRFLVEPELEGIWLTDLDANVDATRPSSTRPDRDGRGRLLQLAGRDHTRGLRLDPGACASWVLPAGYRRLEFTAGRAREGSGAGDGGDAGSVTLVIALDGAPLPPIEWRADSPPRDVVVPIAGPCTLTLAASGQSDAALLVVDPKLLR